MKILTIHANFIEFEATKKAFKGAEEGISKEKQRVEECLVVFTAVEKQDEADPQAVVRKYVQEVKNIAQQVTVNNIVLYPYAHLSSALSSPPVAEEVLREAEQALAAKYAVTRAPFGWYKAFTISCKGHPLSELSRQFSADDPHSKPADENGAIPAREFNDEPFVYTAEALSQDSRVRLSTAFIVGKAVIDLSPGAQLGSIGLHHGQAYVDIAGVVLRNEDLKKIEAYVRKICQAAVPFAPAARDDVRTEWQRQILNDIGQDKPVYMLEDTVLVPTYTNPFLSSTKEIAAFRILNLGSAYWRGNENNEQLTRITCVGFSSKERLEEYERKKEEAEARSHLTIGKEQGLFIVSELVGAGLPLLAPKGTIIRNEIIDFLWELHKGRGYQRVTTPHVAKDLLYKKSGHWEKFGNELFHVRGKYEHLVLKPMNCPHHIQIFDNFSYSYRDLPVRFFESTTVYRDEKSGQLLGLSRVRSITQDDGHIFCRISQIKEEVKTIIRIILQFYKTLGMDREYWVSLSVRGDDLSKYLGTAEMWNSAESALEETAAENKLPFKKVKGEATFYGPKLDFMFKDALGREWQLATIQLDFNLPERFDLGFMNEKSRKERPVMIHRAISGSLERLMSVLIEHFAGKFPLWLSPVQVRVLTITDKHTAFARDVVKRMGEKNIRAELDSRTETMGRKIVDALKEKVCYIVTIGDKEVQKKKIAVRDRKGNQAFDVDSDDFISRVTEEITKRRLDS